MNYNTCKVCGFTPQEDDDSTHHIQFSNQLECEPLCKSCCDKILILIHKNNAMEYAPMVQWRGAWYIEIYDKVVEEVTTC